MGQLLRIKWAHRPTLQGGSQQNPATEATRYDIKGRKYIGTLKKCYFEDVGLFNAHLGYRLYYIQSALNLGADERRGRERRSLRLIGDGFRKTVIVNKVMRPHAEDDGILTMGCSAFR